MRAKPFLWYPVFRMMWDLTDLLCRRQPHGLSAAEKLVYREIRRILLEQLQGLRIYPRAEAGLPQDLGEIDPEAIPLLCSTTLFPALQHVLDEGPHDRGRVGRFLYCEKMGLMCWFPAGRRLLEDKAELLEALSRNIDEDYRDYLEGNLAWIEDRLTDTFRFWHSLWRGPYQQSEKCDPSCPRVLPAEKPDGLELPPGVAWSDVRRECDPASCKPFREWVERRRKCETCPYRPFWEEAAEAKEDPGSPAAHSDPDELALSAIMRQVREWRETAGLPASVDLSGKGGRKYYDATDPDPDAEDSASSEVPGAEATGAEAAAAAEITPELKEQTCLFVALLVTERLQRLLQACLGDGSALHQPGAEYAYLILRGYLERLSSQTPQDERATEELLEALPKALGLLFVAPGEPEYLYGEGECEWEFTIRPALIKAVAELRAEVVRRGLLSVLCGTDGQSGDAPVIEETLNLKEIDPVIRVVEQEKAAHLKRLFARTEHLRKPAERPGAAPGTDAQQQDFLDSARQRVGQEREDQSTPLDDATRRNHAWDDAATCAHLLRRLVSWMIADHAGTPPERAARLYQFLRERMLRELRAGGLRRRGGPAESSIPQELPLDPVLLQDEITIVVLPSLGEVLKDVAEAFDLDVDSGTQVGVCEREGRLCPRDEREHLARRYEDPAAEAALRWYAEDPLTYPQDCPDRKAGHPCPYPAAQGVFRDRLCPELASAAEVIDELERADRLAKRFHAMGQESRVVTSYEDALVVSLLRRLVRAVAQDPAVLGDLAHYLYESLRGDVMAALGRRPYRDIRATAETALPVSLREMSPSVVSAAALRILPELDFILPFVCDGIAREGDDAPYLLICSREGFPCVRMREPDYCPEFLSGAPCHLPPLDRMPIKVSRRELVDAAKQIAELEGGTTVQDAGAPQEPAPAESVPAAAKHRAGRPADFGKIRTREDLLKAVRHCLDSLKPEEWTKAFVVEKLRELGYVSISERHFDTRIRNEPFCFADWAQLRDEARSLPSQ